MPLKFYLISYLQKTCGQKSCANPLAPLTDSLRFKKTVDKSSRVEASVGHSNMFYSECCINL